MDFSGLKTPAKILAASVLWASFCRLLLGAVGTSVPALLAFGLFFCIGFIWITAAVGSGVRDANLLTSYWLIGVATVGGGFAALWIVFDLLGI